MLRSNGHYHAVSPPVGYDLEQAGLMSVFASPSPECRGIRRIYCPLLFPSHRIFQN